MVESSSLAVPTLQWDNTVAWFVQNYGGLYPLHTLVDMFVHSPVIALFSLTNAQAATYEQWYALSSDVWVYGPQ